jgi:tetratricopeptide (TPR) repeat protein
MVEKMILNRVALSLLSCLFLLTPPVSLQASPMPSSDLYAIHQRLLKDPGNLDLLYEYAQLAINEGNFESAVGVLEGMLVISRNQPRVLLELGVLYQRLGSPETAYSYLRRAKELSPAESEIALIADEYLREVDNKEESPHSLTGVLRTGLRYQSNPTFSPDAELIRSGGYSIPLPQSQRREGSSNGMLFSRIDHRYRMSEQASLSSDIVAYATVYDNTNQLNFALLDFSTGPQFASSKNAAGQFTVRPYLTLQGSILDDSQMEQAAGVGLEFNSTLGTNTLVKTKYQFRDVEYKNADSRPLASLQGGNEHSLDLRYSTELLREHLIEIGLFGRYRDAERKFLEAEQYDISLRYSVKFDNFLFQDQQKMTFTPFVVRRFVEYGDPDPAIDPSVTRRDRVWRVGLNYQLPLVKSWSVLMDMEHLAGNSNIINYDVVNNLFMVSLQMGF